MLIDMRCLRDRSSAALEAMQDSDINFHQSGSRHMGGSKPESDWDFIAQDNMAVRSFLADIGFTPILTADYEGTVTDSLTAAVYESQSGDVRVQVSLAKDLTVKLKVRDIVRDCLFTEHLQMPKDARTALWNDLGISVRYARSAPYGMDLIF